MYLEWLKVISFLNKNFSFHLLYTQHFLRHRFRRTFFSFLFRKPSIVLLFLVAMAVSTKFSRLYILKRTQQTSISNFHFDMVKCQTQLSFVYSYYIYIEVRKVYTANVLINDESPEFIKKKVSNPGLQEVGRESFCWFRFNFFQGTAWRKLNSHVGETLPFNFSMSFLYVLSRLNFDKSPW